MTDGSGRIILVTGAAGFIGAAVTEALLARGDTVVGVDNLNDYYDVGLKQARLARLAANTSFDFHQIDISDRDRMLKLAADFPGITGIVHLAAQAGVRYSLVNPYTYVTSNVMGQVVMLEMARELRQQALFDLGFERMITVVALRRVCTHPGGECAGITERHHFRRMLALLRGVFEGWE